MTVAWPLLPGFYLPTCSKHIIDFGSSVTRFVVLEVRIEQSGAFGSRLLILQMIRSHSHARYDHGRFRQRVLSTACLLSSMFLETTERERIAELFSCINVSKQYVHQDWQVYLP